MLKKRILVLSSANIDFVQQVERVPYAGETVLESSGSYEYLPGGKGANSAITFSRLGAECVFTCKLGSDQNAAKLKSLYRAEGIDTRFIYEEQGCHTGLASIFVEKTGKNRIVVYPGANAFLRPEDVEEPFNCYPDALFLQLEIPAEAVIEACRIAHERDIPVFVDAAPGRADFPLGDMGHVEIFSPNETECQAFTGIRPVDESSSLRAAIRLSGMVDAGYIVLKLGGRGAFLYDGSEYYVFPAEQVKAVDSTAAGDVFSAAMTYSYVQNGNIQSAIRMASIAAAISVTRRGASTSIPTFAEIMKFRNSQKQESSASHVESAEQAAGGEEEA